MVDGLSKNVKIRGGIPPYGEVVLSGDPYSTLFLITNAFFQEGRIKILNASRADMVLDYIRILTDLDVVIAWEDERTLIVEVPSLVKTDISKLKEFEEFDFQKIIIPAMLHKRGECVVSTALRDEIKFYRGMGIDIKVSEQSTNKIILSKSISSETAKQVPIKHINTTGYKPDYVSARLFARKLFPTMSVTFNRKNPRYLCFSERLLEADLEEYVAPYNQTEFNLFASFGALTTSEIIIRNYNLSESLAFLMSFDSIIGNYQVTNESIKLWKHLDKLQNNYDLRGLQVDAVGYIVLFLSYLTEENITLICEDLSDIEHMVTELNILGCRIDFSRGKEDYLIMKIRPKQAFSSVRSSVSNPRWGGVLVFASVLINGLNRISDYNSLAYTIPYLTDNLQALNINLSD